MPTLPPLIQQATERPHGGEYVLLWDVEVQKRTKTVAPFVFRMTSRAAPTVWPPTTGETFYPFPFEMGEIEQDNEGNLPAVDLAIDNTTRALMRYLHEGQGFEGNRATLYITHADALSTSPAQHMEAVFEVSSAVANDENIALRLALVNLNEKRLPQHRYVQAKCRRKFGGVECAYPITPTAAFDTCPKTVAACTARGDDEVARGLPRLHPRRFGGFPGIATQRTSG